MDNKKFVSVQKAAAMLGVSTSTLYAWSKKGKITIIPPEPPRIEREVVERIAKERKRKEAQV